MHSVIVEPVVARCIRYARLVIVVFTAFAIGAAFIGVKKFAINTDTQSLIAASAKWQEDLSAFRAAFPQLADPILAVVDGDTPEQADRAAETLTRSLAPRSDLVGAAWRLNGGPFFEQNGLLFLSKEELSGRLAELTTAVPLLSLLASDPSLRGLMQVFDAAAVGVGTGQTSLAALEPLMNAVSDTLERAAAGRPAFLSWRNLLSGGKSDAQTLRQLVLLQPVLDYNALEPSGAAVALVRKTIRDLGLTPENGIRVRLTGPAVLANDEFSTVSEGFVENTLLAIAAVACVLLLALRSLRIVIAVLVTLVVGLALTAAAGLLLVGAFNLISSAFAALFVGLGVDFGIQVAVRYRAERHADSDLDQSLVRAAAGVSGPLTLATLSLVAGFLSFLPTDFTGVWELGVIAGAGMVIAYLASLTLLPALLVVLRPPPETQQIGFRKLAPVDRWIEDHRRLIIVGTVVLVIAGAPLLTTLRFDANPVDLRDPNVESIQTYLMLSRDPLTTPNTINVIAPSLAEAEALATRLAALPEVGRTISLQSFVPSDQEEKLAIIRTAAESFHPVLEPTEVTPPPTDEQNRAALLETAENLRASTISDAESARRLIGALDALGAAGPHQRETAQNAALSGLSRLLQQLREAFAAKPVTLDTLPPDLVAQWKTSDGRVRIEVLPQQTDSNSETAMERFAAAVQRVAPNAAGAPITITESGRTVVRAFIEAGAFAFVSISLILLVALRSLRDVAMTLGPLIIAGILTLEAANLLGIPLNFANIITLPLMFAVGVAFHIYYVVAWRAGETNMLQSSLTRAILFSALTTGAAFATLCLSPHPGLVSMGALLTLSLFFTLAAAFIIVPAVLGEPRTEARAPLRLGR
jgi:hopanoid biosynthesis associated RND transporter like protein HpnN